MAADEASINFCSKTEEEKRKNIQSSRDTKIDMIQIKVLIFIFMLFSKNNSV